MKPAELTKAEEQVMQILWKIEKGMVNDILQHFQEPRPAYTTVSTLIRILEKKGFVDHNAFGNTHQYYPLISMEKYKKDRFKGMLKGYFGGSFADMVSFFSKHNEIDVNEMEKIMAMLKSEIKTRKEVKK